MNKTYIIAEIGLNYAYGKDKDKFLSNAKKLIDVAVIAGCDAVKFQKRDPDVCVPEHQKLKEKTVPWEEKITSYIQYKKDIEFDKEQYDEIDRYCKEKGIDWSASPWDMNSAKFLNDNYNLPWIKIASASITDLDLVDYCAQNFKKIIISTGMSKVSEISNAMEILKKHRPSNSVILHCNSSYPAHVKDLNLSYILKLKQQYPWAKCGYSGHEFGLTTSMSAIYLGAEYIERHITLSRDLWGSDQMASIEPQGLFKLVKGIRDLELAYGDGEKRITEEEEKKRESLRKK